MDVKIGNFRYVLDEINMIGYCYDTSDRRLRYKELTIPGQVTYEGKTYRILEIGEGGFYRCRAERIIISDTIRLIRRDAFIECNNLKYIYIPKSVKVIERSCFEYCTNLSDIEFGGDINEVDIEPFAFQYSKIIRDNKCTETTIDNTYYFGNILYSVSPRVIKLDIKPGTKSVILESCDASDIIFPESVNFIHIKRLTGLERAYFPSIEHYLNILQLDTFLERHHGLVDLYFNGKLEKNIKLPQSTVSINNYKFSGSSVESIIFNKDIKFLDRCFRGCLNLKTSSIYLPKNIELFWLDCNLYETKFNYSTLVARHGSLCYGINRLLLRSSLYSLVIYLDDISEVFFVHNITLDYIREVKLVITSSDIDIIKLKELLRVILTRAKSAKITLIGEEFLKISDELVLTTNIIKVDDYLVPYYQNNPVWENFKITPRDDDNDLSYIIVDGETCKVTYNLNTLGDNSYLGVIKIPREKEIDGKLYKVTGIDDFAFSDCYGLEEVVLYRDQEISELAFFNNSDIKITKI